MEKFYAQFPRGTVVGIEATLPAYWFERLLEKLGHALWVGDAARIRAFTCQQRELNRLHDLTGQMLKLNYEYTMLQARYDSLAKLIADWKAMELPQPFIIKNPREDSNGP